MNTKTKAIIAYLVIFTAGLAAGYVIHDVSSVNSRNDRSGGIERGERFSRHDDHRPGGQMGHRANNRLASLLDLNDEQKDDFFQKMDEFRSGIRSDIREFRMQEKRFIINRYNNFREEVSAFLSEEQLIRLDQVAHPDSVRQSRHEMNRK